MATSDPSQAAAPEATVSEGQPAAIAAESPSGEAVSPSTAPSFGWNRYAERLNGRFAMVGFIALLVLEFFTRQDFFTWLGF
ncbi:MAG: chlorophyll a/b-binding protein [Cyanobacteria bacterium]|nr:chlorophyll a/b-binding protein [Cyanobacteriota bacterium]